MELVALNTIFCAVPSEPLTSTLKKGGGSGLGEPQEKLLHTTIPLNS